LPEAVFPSRWPAGHWGRPAHAPGRAAGHPPAQGRKNLVNAAAEEDLAHRQFTVARLGQLWLAGITEHPAAEGKVYCAAVMDASSRRITVWSIDSSQKTELVIDAIGMAILRRRPDANSAILHSGHGTQYISWASGI
jgi:putative transposase